MRRSVSKPITYFIFIILTILWIIPLVLTLLNAIKTNADLTMGNFWSLPHEFGLFDNIAYAWTQGSLGTGFLNSLVYGIIGAVCGIFIASLAAFALTVLNVRAKLFWFLLIYVGTVFPFQIYLIPLFKMYSNFQLYDKQWGLDLFYAAVSIPFCMFVLRNYYTTISKEIVEASRLDGCSDFRIFWQMYLPLSKSPASVLFLFQFSWIWNDLLFGMTLSTSENVRPIMVGMAGLQGVYSGSNLPGVLTASLISSVPTLLLFIVLRKNFMQGLSLSTN